MGCNPPPLERDYLARLGITHAKRGDASTPKPDFLALSYHDVRDDVRADLDDDPLAVSTTHLLQHFEWLKQNGYAVVSLSEIISAKRGQKALPEKSVLLTFDDGYASFYHRVYPLLKMYNYSAVLAVVGKWLSYPPGSQVPYGEVSKDRAEFLRWSELQELAQSPLIEVASHSYDLHHGVLANPQNNQQAAAVTRRYDAETKTYETDTAYRQRILADLSRNQKLLREKIGRDARVIAWPYGRDSAEVSDFARELGIPYNLVLDGAGNDLKALPIIKRQLIDKNPDLATFERLFQPATIVPAKRVVHLDLDYIYDADAKQLRANLDAAVERIKRLRVNVVYLQAFEDADGDGNAQSLYFPNRYLPVTADLFNRVAWQLKTRADVAVYAWMPVSAFAVSPERYRDWGVYEHKVGSAQPSEANYQRLSIFHSEVQSYILEIYEDLAKYATFEGILFHDDAYLSDFEDVSPSTIGYYHQNGFQNFNFNAVRKDKAASLSWARLKTHAIIQFTQSITDRVMRYRPRIKTVRNLYARVITHPESEQWFVQNLHAFDRAYDYTAVMAMPKLEGARDANNWLADLVGQTQQHVDLRRVVFELQSVDWQQQEPIPNQRLVEQMRLGMT